MREVISFRIERKLQLIQHLYKEKEAIPVKKLVDLINVTEKTIRTDISYINENFSFLEIKICPKNRVKLRCPDYIGIENIYRKAMGISLEFQIFEHLLSESNQTIIDYTEKFYISESMFRRVIHKWNKVFANRNLAVSISTYPVVAIQGDEIIVRQLFHRYMVEKYEGDTQSEFIRKINSIWELLTRMWGVFGMKISYATHLKLSYWGYVSMKRMRNGHFINKDYTENRRKMAQLLYSEISKDTTFVKQFSFDNQFRLSEDMLLDIMGIYDYDLLQMEQQAKEISIYEQKELELSVKVVKSFLISLYTSVNYQNSSIEQTSIAVYNSLVFQNKITFFFYNPYIEFKEYVKRENSLLLKAFETSLENSALPNYLKENDELKNVLLYYVVIHSKSLLGTVGNQTYQKKILILTTYHYKYMYWLQDMMRNRFNESVEVSLYQSNQLQFDTDYMNQFDIVLTNYENLPEELESKIIYLGIGISTAFWEKLKSILALLEDNIDRSIAVGG